MDRRYFLSSVTSVFTASVLPSLPFTGKENRKEEFPIIPSYLQQGDIIGITSPAGYITPEEIQPAVKMMESWGYKIRTGDTIGKRDYTFGGTDAERTRDFQAMLDDPDIQAIMCARGGYGAVRIVDKLDWEKFRLKPKWIIGFSDITVFHSHLNRNFGIASIHSKMCNSFPEDPGKAEPLQMETIYSIRDALSGVKMKYTAPPGLQNKNGVSEGVLVGGNLKMLETLSGTKSDLITKQKILFIEDTGEYMYNIDRMLWNLKRSGKLSQLAGLIVGGFKIKVDEGGDEYGKTLQEVVLEKVAGYTFPVCFDFPVGHQKNNFALKCGVNHRLRVSAGEVSLTEI